MKVEEKQWIRQISGCASMTMFHRIENPIQKIAGRTHQVKWWHHRLISALHRFRQRNYLPNLRQSQDELQPMSYQEVLTGSDCNE